MNNFEQYYNEVIEEATGIESAYDHPVHGGFMYWEVERDLAKKYSQEAVNLALEALEDIGPNAVDAWKNGLIHINTFEEMVQQAYN